MNLDVVWDNQNARGDWQVAAPGRLATGNLLRTAVLVSLFTDRRANSDDPPDPGGRRGWWHDTFEGVLIGSRLWQLRRKKIADRNQLQAEAKDIIREALQWMQDKGIATITDIAVSAPPAAPGRPGTVLEFAVTLAEPSNTSPTVVRALWRSV